MRFSVVIGCACAAVLWPSPVVSMGKSKKSWLKRSGTYLPWTQSHKRQQSSAIASVDASNGSLGSLEVVVHSPVPSEDEGRSTRQRPTPTTSLQDNADVASDSPSMMDVDTNAGAGPYVEEYTPVIHQYLGHFLTGYQGLIYDFVAVNKPRAWDPLVDSSSIEDQYTYLAQRPLDFLALGGRAALGAEDDANLPEALRYQRTLQEVLLDLYIDIQSQRASDTFDMRLATAWFQALSSALQTAVITRQVAAVSSIRYYLVSAVKRWLALAEVVYGKRLIGNLTNYRHFLQPEEERHFFRKEPQKAAVVYQETERRSLDAQAYICVMSLWLARDDLMSTDATPVYQQPLGKDEEIVGHLCHYEVIGPQRWAKIYTLFASLAIPGLAKYIEGIMKPDLTQDLTYRGLMDHLVFTPVPI